MLFRSDHTLTINSGATLTLNYVGFSCEDYTLTINGGGKLITETASTEALDGGNVKLENVTIELLRRMYDVDIEVGNGAVIVVDAENIETPIYIPTSTKKLTVKTGGKIEIKNFLNRGIHCAGTLHIDGGSITINGLGSTSGIFEGYGYAPCAVSNAAKLEISNGGTLASTVAGGTVYPEVKDLYNRKVAYWENLYSPFIGEIQSTVYNWFLKGNNIPSGRKNYSEVVALLMALGNTSGEI